MASQSQPDLDQAGHIKEGLNDGQEHLQSQQEGSVPYRSLTLFALLAFLLIYLHPPAPLSWTALSHKQPHVPFLYPHIFHHLGQFSPYFSSSSTAYSPPPSYCVIDQVSILQRHGSRFPTAGASKIIKASLRKLQTAARKARYNKDLAFLRHYRYRFGADDLVPYGVKESKASGRSTYVRYKNLTQAGVFVRSTSCRRVVDTAKGWSKGFCDAANHIVTVPPPLVISDAKGSNDSLANNNCPAFEALNVHWQWASHFTKPIIARLNDLLAGSDSEITAIDVIILFGMCAFDSVAYEKTSDFCLLFSEKEFQQFEYYQDLEKFYNRGYGNPLGSVQGVGYVNELLARLTDKPVSDHTTTNTTLDADESSFPLRKGIYADFSHDNTIAAIVAAMGLFHRQHEIKMSPDGMPENRSWKFGHIAPFAGRIAFERLQCDGTPSIRILANDVLQDLRELCGASDGEPGICSLDNFVKSQRYARVEGQAEFEKCKWVPADLNVRNEFSVDSVMYDVLGA